VGVATGTGDGAGIEVAVVGAAGDAEAGADGEPCVTTGDVVATGAAS